MKKFLFVTDPHVTNRWPESRTDNYLEVILEKLSWCVELSNTLNADIILGGDTLNKYNVRPSVINMVMRVLRNAQNQIFSIIGNHDIYGQNYTVVDSVLIGTLFSSGMVTLLTQEPVFIPLEKNKVIQLTGFSYVPNMDKTASAYEIEKYRDDVVCAIHVVHGFMLESPWRGIPEDKYTLMQDVKTEADIVCVGHEHQGFGVKFCNGTTFTNPGSLGRISSSTKEISRTPKVSLITVYSDKYDVALVDVPSRPGSEVLDRSKIIEEQKQKQMLAQFRKSLETSSIGSSFSLEDLFENAAKQLKIEKCVFDLSVKALESYDASLLGKKGNKE